MTVSFPAARQLLVGLVIVVVGLEIGLRVLGFSYYWAFSRYPDRYRAFAPMPGAEARQTQEGSARVRINRHGFRDREWETIAPGAYRIAVLGDSMTEAVQVAMEETWWRRLEGRLNGCGYGGRPVAVMNFAVSGYGTTQALETLRHHAAALGPDEVWLAFFPGNDVVENHPDLAGDPMRPFLRRAVGDWRMDYGFRAHPRYQRKSAVWGRLYYRYLLDLRTVQAGVMVHHLLALRAAMEDLAGPWAWEPGVDARVYGPPREDAWAQAWDTTRELLRRLRDGARAAGAPLRVIGLSTGAQVMPEGDIAATMARRLDVPDLFYPNWQVGRFAAEDAYAFTDLATPLASQARETGTHFHGFGDHLDTGHWNGDGHAAAAAFLAGRLCEAGAPSGTGD